MANFLEALTAEWFEYKGYFVRRNVHVGKRLQGGYECELDVVAFHPKLNHLVHIEPSMDADSWDKREKRYLVKFELGRKHIPNLFSGAKLPDHIEQIALLGYASTKSRNLLGGGQIMLMDEFMSKIRDDLKQKTVSKAAVPEIYPILRGLQFACHCWK